MEQKHTAHTQSRSGEQNNVPKNTGYFFSVVPTDTAIEKIREIARDPGTETIPLAKADRRILAVPVYSPSDIPGFDRSWKDGYACIAADTTSASEASPVLLTCTGSVEMGEDEKNSISRGLCRYIPTGGTLPPGADAVVMIEYTERLNDVILVKRPVFSGENCIRRDEDFSAGQLIFEAGWSLRPQDIGVLAAIGRAFVQVRKKPRIGIISTGRELVPADTCPQPGQVRDVNSYLISTVVQRCGAVAIHYGIVRDDERHLTDLLSAAAEECDAVIISGGSSKDEKDITARVIENCGTVFIHGISLAPGKPTIIGTVQEKPVIGLPGHPASTFMVLLLVVTPLIQAIEGRTGSIFSTVPVRLTSNVPSEKGRETYIRVRIQDGNATPLMGKSGLLNTLKESNGIIRVPAGVEGLESGDMAEAILW